MRVDAFEPTPETANYLHRNIVQNEVSANVVEHAVALGNREQKVHMGGPLTDPGSFQVQEGGDISMQTLDSFNFLRVDLIKIDVEGYEPEVLEGARTLIREKQPIIFFELNLPVLRKHGKGPLKRIEESLKGYTFYVDNKKVSRLWQEALKREPKFFLFNKGGIVFDVLALPPQQNLIP